MLAEQRNGPGPTLLEIIDANATIDVYCPACRIVEPADVVRLANRFGTGIRIGRVRFTCSRIRAGRLCRMRRTATVNLPGNTNLGRPRLWPPLATD